MAQGMTRDYVERRTGRKDATQTPLREPGRGPQKAPATGGHVVCRVHS